MPYCAARGAVLHAVNMHVRKWRSVCALAGWGGLLLQASWWSQLRVTGCADLLWVGEWLKVVGVGMYARVV